MAIVEMLGAIAPAVGGFIASIASAVIGEMQAKSEHIRKMEVEHFQRETARIEATERLEMAKFNAAEALRQHDRDQDQWNWNGLKTSLEHDSAISGTSQWVADFRAMVRPGVTIGAVFMLAIGYIFALQPLPVLEDIAMTSVFWWFGSRSIERSHPRVYSASDWRRTIRPVAPSRMEPRDVRDPAGLTGSLY